MIFTYNLDYNQVVVYNPTVSFSYSVVVKDINHDKTQLKTKKPFRQISAYFT